MDDADMDMQEERQPGVYNIYSALQLSIIIQDWGGDLQLAHTVLIEKW